MTPAAVSVTPPCARSNRRALKDSSSCLIWKVTAGCVMNSASAALVKDRCFATARNTRRRRSAIFQYRDGKGYSSIKQPRWVEELSLDDVVDRRLLHCPVAGIPVVAGQ